MRIWKIMALVMALFVLKPAMADEGMWLPMLLKKINEGEMQRMGLKLSAEDIYSINNASLKDAVVSLNGGSCTGEIVSDEGLVFTNHHCAYDLIAKHSTKEDDYLANGFWAQTQADEFPNPNYTASILQYMENVTEIVNKATENAENPMQEQQMMKKVVDSLVSAATEGNHYDAEVKSMFYGNDHYLFVYEVFKDVRLVGAPPSSIGKFGGDTDNWMWPRHTGDFAVLRIYSGPDGKPAEFSEDNIPYKPKKHFKISKDGYKEGDFSMIYGYPGRTERYLTSHDIEFKLSVEQPALIEMFEMMLAKMKLKMDSDREAALDMASDYASLSNYYKYLKGQNKGLREYDLVAEKKGTEQQWMNWVNRNTERKKKYGQVLETIQNAYTKRGTITPGFYYFGYGMFRMQTLGQAISLNRLKSSIEQEVGEDQIAGTAEKLKESAINYHKNTYIGVEKQQLTEMMVLMNDNMPEGKKPKFLAEMLEEYDDMPADEAIRTYMTEDVYAETVVLDSSEMKDLLEKPKAKKIAKDPLVAIVDELVSFYRENYILTFQSTQQQVSDQLSLFVEGLREWKEDEKFYPDANSTLRLTYGSVESYYPRDAVFYDYYTTHEGLKEKNIDGDDEFDVPEKLEDLIADEKFPEYGNNDTLRLCFLTNNDITGGNSGSPVINGSGHLIGIAFDGNWESMTGDLLVNPRYNRTINVDIRYVLYVIDKYAEADHLIDELTIAESEVEAEMETTEDEG